jgi:hypothetical protein
MEFVVIDTESDKVLPYTLPYVQEKERLLYRFIVPVPVFRRCEQKDDSELYGALLFFLGENAGFPKTKSREGQAFRLFMENLSQQIAMIVELHNYKLGFPGNLSEKWDTLRKAKGADAGLAKIRLIGRANEVDRTSRDLLKELVGPNFFALRSEDLNVDGPITTSVVLVAPQANLKSGQLRQKILQILVEKFSNRSVTFEVSLDNAEEELPDKFCLTNCEIGPTIVN